MIYIENYKTNHQILFYRCQTVFKMTLTKQEYSLKYFHRLESVLVSVNKWKQAAAPVKERQYTS